VIAWFTVEIFAPAVLLVKDSYRFFWRASLQNKELQQERLQEQLSQHSELQELLWAQLSVATSVPRWD